MTGISAQYVDGLELRIKELVAYINSLSCDLDHSREDTVRAAVDYEKRIAELTDELRSAYAVISMVNESERQLESRINILEQAIDVHLPAELAYSIKVAWEDQS